MSYTAGTGGQTSKTHDCPPRAVQDPPAGERVWHPIPPRPLVTKDTLTPPPLVTTCGQRAYPKALRCAEMFYLKRRWEAAGLDRTAPQVGLAISGGGIRSATFALGVLQALATARDATTNTLLRGVDYLSTVSGGGYIGGFLGALISRKALSQPCTGDSRESGIDHAEAVLTDPESDPVQWLRENGRYMAPSGAGDEILTFSSYLRNWVAIHVILATMILAAFAGLQWLRPSAEYLLKKAFPPEALIRAHLWWSPYVALPILTFLVLALPLGWAFWYERYRFNSPASALFPWLVQVFLLAVALVPCWVSLSTGLTGVWSWAVDHYVPDAIVAASLMSIAAYCAGGFAFLLHGKEWNHLPTRFMRNWLTKMLAMSLGATACLFVIALIDSLGQTLYAWFSVRGNASIGFLGGTGLTVFITVARKAVTWLDGKAGGTGPRPRWQVPIGLLAGLGAVLVFGLLLVTLSAVSHAVAWGGLVPENDPWHVMSERRGRPASLPVVVGTDGHAVVKPYEPPQRLPGASHRYTEAAATLCVFTTILSLLFGQGIAFINRSSHQGLYCARLTRAYLGASNPKRKETPAISDAAPGDDIEIGNYAPHQGGGPLHLLNVTVNETVGGESQIEYRDRKGLGMAVGPAGLSVGVRHHALWKRASSAIAPLWWYEKGSDGRLSLQPSFHMLAESLPEPASDQANYEDADHKVETVALGDWVAISGAAFTTGLGARTNLGISAILGFVNIRLGYWWDSMVRPDMRPGRAPRGLVARLGETFSSWLPVQAQLVQELLARFYGPHRQLWYLSDGGHFENAACYELIRRRLPLIICCDDGQDENYAFEDLANLVRKARSDFQAEICFLNEVELAELNLGDLRRVIGTLDDLCPRSNEGDEQSPKYSKAHAALAKVTYLDPRGISYLLVLKPTLRGDESLDIRQYHASRPSFPQEPTIDQYFDEAQWESYRHLGELIGRRVFQKGIERLCALAAQETRQEGQDGGGASV